MNYAATYRHGALIDSVGIEVQQARLKAYADENGLEVVADYCDDGGPGTLDRCHELNRLRSDIARLPGRIDVILVWRLDRLGHGTREAAEVIAWCKRHGVEVVIVGAEQNRQQ